MRPKFIVNPAFLALAVLSGASLACASINALLPAPTATVIPSPTATALPTDTAVPTLPPTQTALPPTPIPPTLPPTSTPLPTPEPMVRLMTVGDVMLGRTVGVAIVKQGIEKPFANVADTLNLADLLLFNLECPIGKRGQPYGKAYNFLCPPEAADTLKLIGTDLVSWGNNHSFDYGFVAMEEGWNLLTERDIKIAGLGWNNTQVRTPVLLERNGITFAVLSYVDVPVEDYGFDTRTWLASPTYPGIAWAIPEHIAADVAAIKPQVDHVIVMFQNGFEGRTNPTEAQILQAHTAIDAGASLVIGSHPHLLQPYEAYNNGLIFYSLGNFVFDGFVGNENKSVIAEVLFTKTEVHNHFLYPVVIELGFPRLATDLEAPEILSLIPPFR